jgi:hypothetical protein
MAMNASRSIVVPLWVLAVSAVLQLVALTLALLAVVRGW